MKVKESFRNGGADIQPIEREEEIMAGIMFRNGSCKCFSCMYLLNIYGSTDKDCHQKTKAYCMIPNCVKDREIKIIKKEIKQEMPKMSKYLKALSENLKSVGLDLRVVDDEDRYVDIYDENNKFVARLLQNGEIRFATDSVQIESDISTIVDSIKKDIGVLEEGVVI